MTGQLIIAFETTVSPRISATPSVDLRRQIDKSGEEGWTKYAVSFKIEVSRSREIVRETTSTSRVGFVGGNGEREREGEARTDLINNERGRSQSTRGPAAFNYFPREICVVGRETRNIGLSFDLSSTLARICNREISRDSRRAIFLSFFGKSRETTTCRYRGILFLGRRRKVFVRVESRYHRGGQSIIGSHVENARKDSPARFSYSKGYLG